MGEFTRGLRYDCLDSDDSSIRLKNYPNVPTKAHHMDSPSPVQTIADAINFANNVAIYLNNQPSTTDFGSQEHALNKTKISKRRLEYWIKRVKEAEQNLKISEELFCLMGLCTTSNREQAQLDKVELLSYKMQVDTDRVFLRDAKTNLEASKINYDNALAFFKK